MSRTKYAFALAVLLLVPEMAFAADLEQTFRNLVNVFVGRLLPVLALGYLGKNIFAHIQGDPNARNESARVVIATACLIGINGAWTLISQQVR
jgi:hypothetical protein